MPPRQPADRELTAVLRGRCTPDLKRRADDYIRKKGVTEATLVRQAVIEFLERAARQAAIEGTPTLDAGLNESRRKRISSYAKTHAPPLTLQESLRAGVAQSMTSPAPTVRPARRKRAPARHPKP